MRPDDLGLPPGEGEGRQSVLVATSERVQLRVEPVEDDRTPEGSVCLGTFIGGRLVGRRVAPTEALDELREFHLFDDPVHLGLVAFEDSPGLQCRLLALLPADRFPLQEDDESEDEPDEPWRVSVPPPEFEAAEEAPDEEETPSLEEGAAVPVYLGNIVRLARDRKHPDDLAAEASDVLMTVLTGAVSEVVDRVLEDLLEEDERGLRAVLSPQSFSLRWRIGVTPFGSALPPLFFITCPTKKPISLTSPPRKRATSPGFAARTSSTQPSSAPVSWTCSSPSRSRDDGDHRSRLARIGQLGEHLLRGLMAHDAVPNQRHELREPTRRHREAPVRVVSRDRVARAPSPPPPSDRRPP